MKWQVLIDDDDNDDGQVGQRGVTDLLLYGRATILAVTEQDLPTNTVRRGRC